DDAAAGEPALQDGTERVPRIGQIPPQQDGDLTPPEPTMPEDGIIDTTEPPPQQDAAEAQLFDSQADADATLLANPPARYDPLLFQIEDLDPIRDNRTVKRLFTQEPYDPVGIKVGSFVLFPEVKLGTSYYSNVFHSPGAKSDIALDFQPSVRLVSNWATHALE